MLGNEDFSKVKELAPSEKYTFDFLEDEETDGYLPFKNVDVHNEKDVPIKIYRNRRKGYKYLQTKGMVSYRADKITRITVENSSTTDTTKVTVTCDNDVSELECLRRIARLE